MKKCQPRLGRGWVFFFSFFWGVGGEWGPLQEMFCSGCQCASDQALQMDLLPGNAVVVQTAGKPDSNAERRSSLYVNQGDFTMDWLGC